MPNAIIPTRGAITHTYGASLSEGEGTPVRRLPLLVLAPAVFLGTALSATPASAAPLPATGLRQFAAIGGVGLTWTASPDPATGYHIYRSGSPLTDVTDLSAPLTYIDTTLDAGASANYTVIAYDDNGAAPTGTLPITRPAADATVGT